MRMAGPSRAGWPPTSPPWRRAPMPWPALSRADPAEAARLPAALRRQEAREARYAALLDEMAALVDPDPHDPWPRHAAHSGASHRLDAGGLPARVGGLPAVPVGEDRALFEALRPRRHAGAALPGGARHRFLPAGSGGRRAAWRIRCGGGWRRPTPRRSMRGWSRRWMRCCGCAAAARCAGCGPACRGPATRCGWRWRWGWQPALLADIVRLPRFWRPGTRCRPRAWPLQPPAACCWPAKLGAEIGRATTLLRRAARRPGAGQPAAAAGMACSRSSR